MLRAEALRVHAGGLPQGRCLLGGLTCQVRAGQRWVVLGPNGAGKSTLLATLAGLMPVIGGDLLLGERMPAQWAAPDLAQQRAWCPQFWVDPFPSTVLETLTLAMTGPPRPRFGLPELLDRLDLQGLAQQDVRVLSGGERQRVALAGALLQGAPLLLLDEPTAHLDLAHQQALRRLLEDWARCGGAVVATVHDLNMAAALATHAIVLDGLGGADVGPADAVLRPQILSRVFGVPVDEVEVCGQRRFWVGDVGDNDGPA